LSITGHRKPRTTKIKPFFLKKRGGRRGVRDHAPPVNSSEFLVPVDEDSTTCNSKSINRVAVLATFKINVTDIHL